MNPDSAVGVWRGESMSIWRRKVGSKSDAQKMDVILFSKPQMFRNLPA
jgi:hypothetical protein